MISDDLIRQVATAYTLPFELLKAQVQVESNGDPNAFRFEPAFFTRYVLNNPASKAARFGPLAACSYGVLQVMLETAYELGFDGRPEDLFVDRIGLTWGAKKMRALLDANGDNYPVALQRYNGTGAAAEAYAARVYQEAGEVMP